MTTVCRHIMLAKTGDRLAGMYRTGDIGEQQEAIGYRRYAFAQRRAARERLRAIEAGEVDLGV